MFCGWEGKRHHWLIARKNSLLKRHLELYFDDKYYAIFNIFRRVALLGITATIYQFQTLISASPPWLWQWTACRPQHQEVAQGHEEYGRRVAGLQI